MKTTPFIAAVFSSVLATTAIAAQDDKHETHGAASDTHGSAMSENHQRANSDGQTPKEKMKTEVQDDWREDAEERREADVSKPEQR